MAELAATGLGIIQGLDFILEEFIARGALERVLPEAASEGPPVWLIYPERRFISSRVRAFIEHMTANVRLPRFTRQ
jgi:LysR family transcriptional regulator for bpeEF and oprC